MHIQNLIPGFKRYCLFEKGISSTWYKAIVKALDLLETDCSKSIVSEFSTADIRNLLYHYGEQRQWSAQTFRHYRQYFCTFFNWCVLQGFIKSNPATQIEKPKLPKSLKRSLSKDEATKVLAQSMLIPWRYKLERSRNTAIIGTFIFTGLRLQELQKLRCDHVNVKTKTVLVVEGKGQKDRLVPIHPSLLPLLRTYLREKEEMGSRSEWIFSSVLSPAQLTKKNIRTVCQKVSKAAGIYFTPHMLRHTFARLSIEADLNIYKLKEIMGHEKISTTQGYLSISTESIRKAFEDIQLL